MACLAMLQEHKLEDFLHSIRTDGRQPLTLPSLLYILDLCRNECDQLAFAVHAYLVADGYKLIAVGKNADVPDEGSYPTETGHAIPSPMRCPVVCLHSADLLARLADIPDDKKRSSVKGWNKDGDSYAFRYEDPTGNHPGQDKICNLNMTAFVSLLSTQQSLWGILDLQGAGPAESRKAIIGSVMPVISMSSDQQTQLS